MEFLGCSAEELHITKDRPFRTRPLRILLVDDSGADWMLVATAFEAQPVLHVFSSVASGEARLRGSITSGARTR